MGGASRLCTHGDEFGVEVLPCLTSSCLKDQQVLVAQIVVKWHCRYFQTTLR